MNLTGTCWRFNDDINNNIRAYSNFYWSINFRYWGGQTTYVDIQPYCPVFSSNRILFYSTDDENYRAYYNRTWVSESYKTIIILGGEEVTDTYLYDFLTEAAVQIPIVQTKVNGVWKYGQVNVKEGNWKLSKGLYVKDNTWIKK